jgi:hypothetical protein
MRNVARNWGKAFFCMVWESLFTVDDGYCSVEEKRLTRVLGVWVLFRDYCEHCFFLFFEGGIEFT